MHKRYEGHCNWCEQQYMIDKAVRQQKKLNPKRSKQRFRNCEEIGRVGGGHNDNSLKFRIHFNGFVHKITYENAIPGEMAMHLKDLG